MVLATLLLLVGTVLLIAGAELAVSSAARLARLVGLPLFALGAVLFGIDLEGVGTAVLASAQGHTGIAAGEAFGTMLFVASFAFGAALLLGRRPVPSPSTLMVLAPAVPIAAAGLSLYDGGVDRVEAVILLLSYAGYVGVVIADGRAVQDRAAELEREAGVEAEDAASVEAGVGVEAGAGDGAAEAVIEATVPRWKGRRWTRASTLLTALGGLALLGAGAWALVQGGVKLLERTGLREGFVGVAVIAVLSGLDEVMLEVVPVRQGRPSLATGNLFGTIAAFPTAVLGLAALVRPIPSDTTANLALIAGAALYAAIAIVFLVRGRAGRLLGGCLIVAFPAWLVLTTRM